MSLKTTKSAVKNKGNRAQMPVVMNIKTKTISQVCEKNMLKHHYQTASSSNFTTSKALNSGA